jgi:hypothetical protein
MQRVQYTVNGSHRPSVCLGQSYKIARKGYSTVIQPAAIGVMINIYQGFVSRSIPSSHCLRAILVAKKATGAKVPHTFANLEAVVWNSRILYICRVYANQAPSNIKSASKAHAPD